MKSKPAYIAAGLGIVSFILHFMALAQTSHPTGWDGYYYVMQVHSWQTYGHLQSPDFSLIYPYLTAVTFLADDYLSGFRIGVALLSAALAVVAFLMTQRKTGDVALGFLVSAYLIFSPTITYLILQFPKNVLALIFLLGLLAELDREKKWTSAILLVVALFTHRMIGGFALLAVLIYTVRRVPFKFLAIGAVVVVGLSFLPGVLHISDLARFSDQFSFRPQWAPMSFFRIFTGALSAWWIIDLVLISLMAAWLLWRMIRGKIHFDKTTVTWFVITVICLFPFSLVSAGSAGFRFFLVAPVFLVLTVTCFSGVSSTTPVGWRPSTGAVMAAGVCFIVASVFSYRSYNYRQFDPPNGLYATIVAEMSKRYQPSDYPLVIAPKGLAEIVIFRTEFDALNWLPPAGTDPQHVLRIVSHMEYYHLRRLFTSTDMTAVAALAPGYFVMSEATWNTFVEKARQAKDQFMLDLIYDGHNPMLARPYFLQKGKPQ